MKGRSSHDSWLGNWSWDKLKDEVDRGYKRFFEKRGMGLPDQWRKGDFIFGKGASFLDSPSANNPQSSSCENDQPTPQSLAVKNQNPS